MLNIKELFWGTPEEINNDKRYSYLNNKKRLTPKEQRELGSLKGASRRLFLKRTAGIGTAGIAFGGGLGLLWALESEIKTDDLLNFEERYKDLLLQEKEEKLRVLWLSKIAQVLSRNTNFSGNRETLTENFFFVFSKRDYLEKYTSLPGSEPGGAEYSNGATIFIDNGISGTVVSVAKVSEMLRGTVFSPVRVMGIVCAHEMGHRTCLQSKKLNEPFLLPSGDGIMMMKVTETLGLTVRGVDAFDPNRPLNALSRLDETAAEIQAQKTYGIGYNTPGSPIREAPTLLFGILNLLDLLDMSYDSLITSARNNDPFGFLAEVSGKTGASLNYRDKIIHGLNISYSALDGDIEKTKGLIKDPAYKRS
ncbi:hypothetical protein A2617_04805 [Candidatus Daviesbacteria bacterium RIFOXYD1_FULL_41_10]|uniref:Uncharacterized protein n=2 Tax=Candidatus Daviesiibacteriota TaxID=1752718 RepID=A0A1F5N2X6_9BACT|nr:MAG: hypothetical protein UU67_C0045G0006 [Candidatus Daviesbacteria bacterium GW2011_GWB1_41_5]OGE71967.1 MAG: hypothetical protein A2617_04805 [Candidatus Daviesbacteria bacterium RIFOXYD1_FULL_41_10]